MVIVGVILGVLVGVGLGVAVAVVLVRSSQREAEAARQQSVHDAVAALADQRDAAVDAAVATAVDRVTAVAAERLASHTQAAVETVTTLAGDKLATHTEAAAGALDLRSQSFEQRVEGMNAELRQLRDLVTQLQKEKAEQHGQLVTGLAEAVRTSAELASTTQALREALSSSRARGQWGERMADDVLTLAGMLEGVNYRKQVTLPGGGRPDVSFVLPQGRSLHMDVKFPIDNYLRHLEATTPTEADEAAKAFLRDVRNRIKELTGRGYLDPASTVGYVLLFIPNEAVYGFVHERDPQLLDFALGHQVVMCSPFTLFAVLGVIRQSVDTFHLARTSDEILQCLGDFTTQWDAFSDRLDTMGRQLGTVQRSYDELAGVRRRQLTRHLDEVERLRTLRGLADADGAGDGVGPSDAVVDDHRDADGIRAVVEDDREVEVEVEVEPLGLAVGDDVATPAAPTGPAAAPGPGRRVARLRPVGGR